MLPRVRVHDYVSKCMFVYLRVCAYARACSCVCVCVFAFACARACVGTCVCVFSVHYGRATQHALQLSGFMRL